SSWSGPRLTRVCAPASRAPPPSACAAGRGRRPSIRSTGPSPSVCRWTWAGPRPPWIERPGRSRSGRQDGPDTHRKRALPLIGESSMIRATLDKLRHALSPRPSNPRPAVSPDVKRNLRELDAQGWTRIEQAVPSELCDRVFQDFHRYCREHAEEEVAFRDGRGLHSRLTNFHMASDAAMEIGLNPRVLALTDAFFGQRTAICSSLTFEKGSQQSV